MTSEANRAPGGERLRAKWYESVVCRPSRSSRVDTNPSGGPMRYLLTIYHDEAAMAARSPEDGAKISARYFAVAEEMRGAGVYVGGEGLEPTATATTVRVRDSERLTIDGPFAETKEQLAGFYLVDCKDLDEAIEWAAKIPGSEVGSVEVRPIMDYEARDAARQAATASA